MELLIQASRPPEPCSAAEAATIKHPHIRTSVILERVSASSRKHVIFGQLPLITFPLRLLRERLEIKVEEIDWYHADVRFTIESVLLEAINSIGNDA